MAFEFGDVAVRPAAVGTTGEDEDGFELTCFDDIFENGKTGGVVVATRGDEFADLNIGRWGTWVARTKIDIGKILRDEVFSVGGDRIGVTDPGDVGIVGDRA